VAETTGIEWCDSTFNPWIGCEKVSPGCAHCYAETLVTGRMGRAGTWGADGVRQRTSPANWRKPLQWERQADAFYAEHGHRRRVFCASLADVFEPRRELRSWRTELFELIARTPRLDWLVLTKRPEEARDWLFEWDQIYGYGTWVTRDDEHHGWGCPSNLWIGTSIENARHTWRADVLREIPAAVRFISAEPLLGSLFDLPRGSLHVPIVDGELQLTGEDLQAAMRATPDQRAPLDLTGIDWLIAGGESGPNARPMDPDWARELRDACVDNGVAFFFKQHGGRTPKAGGKTLDGREWCEMPREAVPA
jgi:protein gp37